MRTNAAGLAIIKRFETCQLTAYQDRPGGIWTIGYGCTHGVMEGDIISQADADARLIHDVVEIEGLVLRWLNHEINDNQLSALVSFTFNVGLGRPAKTLSASDPGKDGFAWLKNGKHSSLLNYMNFQQFDRAALEFEKWAHVPGMSMPSSGLLERRQAEKQLFLTPEAPCSTLSST